LAFSADPAARWLFPDSSKYLTHGRDFLSAFARKAFDHETAYYIEGWKGSACWLPPGIDPDEDELISVLRRNVPEHIQEEVLSILEQTGKYRPSDMPCWYLPVMGVDPIYQNRGLGSLLMQHALARINEDGITAYLESSNPSNIPFYERHGFEVMGKVQVGSSPVFHPMLRHPRSVPLSSY
jgi:ribosomal protein S18 acetylase RimI-like enzyme